MDKAELSLAKDFLMEAYKLLGCTVNDFEAIADQYPEIKDTSMYEDFYRNIRIIASDINCAWTSVIEFKEKS